MRKHLLLFALLASMLMLSQQIKTIYDDDIFGRRAHLPLFCFLRKKETFTFVLDCCVRFAI